MGELCVLRSEVNDTQVAEVLKGVKKVDSLQEWFKKYGNHHREGLE